MDISASTTVLLVSLAAASYIDSKTHRIPNWITFGLMILGLAFAYLEATPPTLLGALAGLGVGLLGLLPMYAAGSMGAGDVKLMAAVGTFLGPALTVQTLLYTLMVGGVLAIIAVLRTDGVRETLSRYAFGIRHLITTRKWMGGRHRDAATPRLKFPYALAIALGTALALYGPRLIPL